MFVHEVIPLGRECPAHRAERRSVSAQLMGKVNYFYPDILLSSAGRGNDSDIVKVAEGEGNDL
jgi:hypothetical protein